jgi:hypothetical protein
MAALGVSSRSIIAVAGRRIDTEDAQTARFPFRKVDGVRAALGHTLENAAAKLLVSSAACGSDLLALDAASALGIQTRIILPFVPDTFRDTSVVDRPNPAYWGRLYDRLIAEARGRGDLIILDYDPDDPSAYTAANQAIIDEALRAAHEGTLPARLVAVIVWEGLARNGDDATDHFRRIALERGFSLKQISTLVP